MPAYWPRSFVIVACLVFASTTVLPVPNVRNGWSLPANAAAGRTRAEAASAVKIHFFMLFLSVWAMRYCDRSASLRVDLATSRPLDPTGPIARRAGGVDQGDSARAAATASSREW